MTILYLSVNLFGIMLKKPHKARNSLKILENVKKKKKHRMLLNTQNDAMNNFFP